MEDVSYNFQFLIPSLVFVLMVLVLSLTRRRLKLEHEMVFFALLCASILSIVLDIAAVLSIQYSLFVPSVVSEFIRKFYLVSVVIVGFGVLLYTFGEICEKTAFEDERRFLHILPLAVSVPVIMGLNLENKMNDTMAFGYSVYASIIISMIYIVSSFYYAVRYRNRIETKRFAAIIIAVVTFLVCGCVQINCQNIRIVSTGISIFIVFMFVGIENPEDYLDKFMETFNADAFDVYLKSRFDREKRISIAYVIIKDFSFVQNTLGIEMSSCLLKNAAAFFSSIKGSKVFYTGNYSFMLAFEREAHFIDHVQDIRRRFSEVWCVGEHGNMLELEMNAAVVAYPAMRMPFNPDVKRTIELLRYYGDQLCASKEESYICVDVKQIRESDIIENITDTLKNAVQNKRVEVFYQPVFSVFENRCVELEALLRVKDERDVYFDNDILVPLAEQTGTIIDIGYELFEQICRFIIAEKIKNTGVTKISVNLSSIQCQQHHMASRMIEIMNRYSVPASMFRFEIKEETAAYITKNFRRNMNQLIARGASFTIDDYGKNKTIDPDFILSVTTEYIKLGQEAVDNYVNNKKARRYLSILCKTLQNMKIVIAASGVENQTAYNELKKLGITQMQGNAFYRPMPAKQIVEVLVRDKAVTVGQEVMYEKNL